MKNIVLIFASCLLLLGCSNVPEDPYLILNPEFKLETISFVLPTAYEELQDPSRLWGAPYFINRLELKEGGNTGELEVSFVGGCARHRFALYAESIYADRQDPEIPLDITLYLVHGHEREECASNQTHTFRKLDISFLTPGLYNITIENTSNRNQLYFQDYEIK